MGFGVQRKRTVINNDLPDNKLYRNFVRAGALLTEEEWLGGPSFEGHKTKFLDEEEVESNSTSVREVAAITSKCSGDASSDRDAGAAEITVKSMKRYIIRYLDEKCTSVKERLKGVKRKWVRSAAVEEMAADGDNEAEERAGELFERATKKLIKRGRLCERGEGSAVYIFIPKIE